MTEVFDDEVDRRPPRPTVVLHCPGRRRPVCKDNRDVEGISLDVSLRSPIESRQMVQENEFYIETITPDLVRLIFLKSSCT